MSSPTPKKPWFERPGAVWALATLAFLFVGTWLAGKLLGWRWPDGSDWQAIWTFFTFLVAAIAAAVALQQLRAHYHAQREQSRPYVIVDFEFRSTLVSIEVKNIGATPAQGVELTWDPAPVGDEERHTAALRRNLVDGTIPFLAPGRAIRYFLARGEHLVAPTALPTRYVVSLRYHDLAGTAFGPEEMILDFDQWSESLVETDYDNKNWNEFKRQAEEQKKVRELLGKTRGDLQDLNVSVAAIAATLRDSLREARLNRARQRGRTRK